MAKSKKQLTLKWSKSSGELLFSWPGEIEDAIYVGKVFPKSLEEDLTRMGYDITTLKFSIDLRTA